MKKIFGLIVMTQKELDQLHRDLRNKGMHEERKFREWEKSCDRVFDRILNGLHQLLKEIREDKVKT